MTWSTVVSMPTARFGLAAVTGNDGSIYAFGGGDNAGNALAVNERLSGIGGFAGAGAGKSHDAVMNSIDASALTSTVTISPLSSTLNQPTVSDAAASDDVTPQAAVDSVFADDSLSVSLADTLI
jgi:hypothetical protein